MGRLMRLTVSVAAGAVLALGSVATTNAPAFADGNPSRAEKVLIKKGLTRDDRKFLLADDEGTVIEKYKEAREIQTAFQKAMQRYGAILDFDEQVQMLTMQQQSLQAEINSIQMELNSMPLSTNGRMRALQQSRQAPYRQQQNQDRSAMNQINQQLQQLKTQAPKDQERKSAAQEYDTQQKAYVASVRELDELVSPLLEKYHELGLDEDVKTALNDIRTATTQNVKLGPSQQVLAAVQLVKEMKKMKVLSVRKSTARKKARSR
jgi:hypothetical protein